MHWTKGSVVRFEDIPAEAIGDIYRAGDVTPECREWTRRIDLTVDREAAIERLKRETVYCKNPLEQWPDSELTEAIFFIAVCAVMSPAGKFEM